MKTTAGSLEKGEFVELNGDPFQITKIDHNFRGRGQANLKIKLKNVQSGNTVEKTYGPSNTVERIDVDAIEMQFLYKDNANLTFMNEQTYEQYEISTESVGDLGNYFKEGQAVYILVLDGKALSVRPPNTVRLEVIEAHDAVRGYTAAGAKKMVTLETGVKVNVPLFIKKGEVIVINPETGEYMERA